MFLFSIFILPVLDICAVTQEEGTTGEEYGEEDFDWTYEQALPDENIVTAGHKYGFANNTTGVFIALQVSSQLKVNIKLRCEYK